MSCFVEHPTFIFRYNLKYINFLFFFKDLRPTTQRMDSITSSDQRLMIERLLQDNDFLDPINIADPAEYAENRIAVTPHSPASESFFPSNTLETILPSSPTTPIRLVFLLKKF